jgi:hypothetical protein
VFGELVEGDGARRCAEGDATRGIMVKQQPLAHMRAEGDVATRSTHSGFGLRIRTSLGRWQQRVHMHERCPGRGVQVQHVHVGAGDEIMHKFATSGVYI